MKNLLRNVFILLGIFRKDPLKKIRLITKLPSYFHDLNTLEGQRQSAIEKFPLGKPFPCLNEKFADSGSATGHYFHQDLLVARRININTPHRHVDIGSRIDGFVAHVAAFREIEVFDVRPLPNSIPNVRFKQADMMTPIQEDMFDYCDSLSCLHAIEHFGLGRYGDPVSYEGYLLGLNNLYLMLKKRGKLYLSVPIGPQRIEFNAHRVFSIRFLLNCFHQKYNIDKFSFVDDQGYLHENTPLLERDVENNYGCVYGCGIFELTKL